jgi:antitoxin (DNA-binding transcriptional repressor) of toxin-antitoxin stability system
MTTARIRNPRKKFPKIRQLVETKGEVVVTERGEPRFLLRPYQAQPSRKPASVDLYKRLVARMPKMLTEKQSQAIDQLNRG